MNASPQPLRMAAVSTLLIGCGQPSPTAAVEAWMRKSDAYLLRYLITSSPGTHFRWTGSTRGRHNPAADAEGGDLSYLRCAAHALDRMDMVSAVCPNCHILLVEASNASLSNLTAAVAEAAALGATEISNSYGGPEFSGETAFDATFDHPAIAITASSGDMALGPYTHPPRSS